MSSTTRNVITRLAAGASLALLAAGCGSGPASMPSAPTRVSYPGVFGPTPDPLISGPYTISGVVTESGRPIAGANVNAFVNQGNFGYSYMWAYGPLLTDGGGRYRMTGLPAGVRVWFQVYKDGYVQQCAAAPVTLQGHMAMDLALVSKANLTASTTQSAPGFRSVSGTIVEMTSAGKQPVAGAFVDWEPLEDFPAAVTYSDGAGRFALCGLPQDEAVQLGASLVFGRIGYSNIPPSQTAGVEITLP
jgi:Carboxypeptidase regulatory-like domain